jgi:hypothetical protein
MMMLRILYTAFILSPAALVHVMASGKKKTFLMLFLNFLLFQLNGELTTLYTILYLFLLNEPKATQPLLPW